MIKQCKECKVKFMISDYVDKIGRGKFCSRKCYGAWQSENCINVGENSPTWKGGKIKRICRTCGKEFFVAKYRTLTGKDKTCSKQCMGIWRSKNIIGAKSPAWRGGLIKRICKVCGKEFKAQMRYVKYGNAKYCSSSCFAIWNISHNKTKNTSIEIKMERELTRHGIIFKKQHPIRQAKTIPDFFIPPNICVYCDGDYWHNLPEHKKVDFNQNFTLNFLGYKVYRFWEHEINKSISKCVNKINRLSRGNL